MYISSGVSHSDGSCVLGRIHSDVSSNIPKKVYHIVTDNFVNLLHISYAWLYKTECWGRKFHAFSFNSNRNCKIFMTNFNFYIRYNLRTLHIPEVHFRMKLRSWYATMWYTPTWRYATMWYTRRYVCAINAVYALKTQELPGASPWPNLGLCQLLPLHPTGAGPLSAWAPWP